MKNKMEGNKDDYTEPIPLLMVSNKNSREIGKSNFETTILKCEKTIKMHSIKTKPEVKRGKRLTPAEKAFRNRREFNPFLKNAWILMGKAQMEKGDFVEAASTFAYTERLYRDQPQVTNIARSLMALCYTELEWYYDAENLLNQVRRDSIPRASQRPYNTAVTNLLLHQKLWKDALPYLKKEVENLPHGTPKARGAYLLGQVYQILGMKNEAYRALQKCLNQSPPYDLKFNAQIMQTEVMPAGDNKKKLNKLNRMANNPNNKDYLDIIYYAIGNIHLAVPDTAKAIEAYETGGRKAKQNGPSKVALLIRLGDIYWAKQRFKDAKRCYDGAISSLAKEHARYEEINKKTKVLGKLVPHTNVIFEQDSLQAVVRMPETERLAIIDKLIDLEKKRQKELEKQKSDSIAKSLKNKNNITGKAAANGNNAGNDTGNAGLNTNTGGVWYFYNQQSLMQGMEQFKKVWGDRQNEDNWRRSNKTVTTPDTGDTDLDEDKADSIREARQKDPSAAKTEKTAKKNAKVSGKGKDNKEANDSANVSNPLKREYYLAKLPFSKEDMQKSNEKIRNALFPAGVIEKDDLENYPLAQATLTRLYAEFPDVEKKDELLYQLFLLELRWGLPGQADTYRNELAASFPESPYTKIITAPDFEQNARYGKHLEDSLYAATYEAFKTGDQKTIRQNCAISQAKYPEGNNRAKFLFLEAMSELHDGHVKAFTDTLHTVVRKFAKDSICKIAESMIKGIEAGRIPGKGEYDMFSLWNSRNDVVNRRSELLSTDTLSAERFADFFVIIPYMKDSIDEGKLLYEVSRFNFTSFDIRNFDIEIIEAAGAGQMRIKTFLSFDEAHHYIQEIYKDSLCQPLLKNLQPVLISEENLKLIGIKYTIDEYKTFFSKYFQPDKVKKDLKFDNNPNNFIWDEFQETDNKDDKTEEEIEVDDDGGEWY